MAVFVFSDGASTAESICCSSIYSCTNTSGSSNSNINSCSSELPQNCPRNLYLQSLSQFISSNNGPEKPLQLFGKTAQRPFRIVPHFIAFTLLFSHGRTAIHFSTELNNNSTYSTFSNFFIHAVLNVIFPEDIVTAGSNLVEKNCALTISYPLKSNALLFVCSAWNSFVSSCFVSSSYALNDAFL